MRKLIREFLATCEGTRQAILLRMFEDRSAQMQLFEDRLIRRETDEASPPRDACEPSTWKLARYPG